MDKFMQMYMTDPGPFIGMLAVVGGLSVAAISVLTRGIVRIVQAGTRERSRRELAAYVAEGTMTPDVAQNLLEAGRGPAWAEKLGADWFKGCRNGRS